MKLEKVLAFVLLTCLACASAREVASQTVRIDTDDIGGVVSGPAGPEAGVWVIAETTELPTRFARIVVTDDRGQYVIPDLPKATYRVWVRGYGLVDGPKVPASPGRIVNLTAVPATNPRAAAEYYPAGFWFSLIRVPNKSEFATTGAGADGNATAPHVKSQAEWLRIMKSGGCMACHQLGSKGTRVIPQALGAFPTSTAAWERRLQSGQAGGQMIGTLGQLGVERALAMFADWTDRIAAGEVPQTPPRPQGIERNVVITEWDWADPKAYLHDEVSTDRRNPTLNANGKIYGALELSADYLPLLDPVRNTVEPRAVDGARSEHAARRRCFDAPAVAVLGQRSHLDEQKQRTQPDVRRTRSRVDHLHRAPARQPTVLQSGLEPSLGSGFSAEPRRPPPRGLRSENREAHTHRHVLQHASSHVRRGREPHVVDLGRRSRGRLAEHEAVRRNG